MVRSPCGDLVFGTNTVQVQNIADLRRRVEEVQDKPAHHVFSFLHKDHKDQVLGEHADLSQLMQGEGPLELMVTVFQVGGRRKRIITILHDVFRPGAGRRQSRQLNMNVLRKFK